MTDSPEPSAKPKRTRKTKAERDAARQERAQAEANKPLSAGFWGLGAGLMLFFTTCFYLDMMTLLNFRSTSTSSGGATGEIVVFILAAIYSLLGRTWGTLIFGLIGLFCLYKSIRRRLQSGTWND